MKKLLSVLLSAVLLCSSFSFSFASGASDTVETYIKKNFPVSYQEGLLAVHKAHPNWNFVALKTGVKLSTAVSNEYNCKTGMKMVDSVYADTNWACATSTCSNGAYHKYYSGANYSASKAFISDCMDPRNNFTDSRIFQFESLDFSTQQTTSGIEKLLKYYGSFMYNRYANYYNTKGDLVTVETKYSKLIYNAAKSAKVNAYFLAARIVQEIGTSASYAGVSGKYKGYEGYFNFYNINATGSNVYANALAKAKLEGWDSPEKAIKGGAAWIANGYINKGQNTGYLQGFNVNPNASNPMYTHQYMQLVYAPRNEAATSKTTYEAAGCLETEKTFIIPVYTDADTTTPSPSGRLFLITKGADISSYGYITGSATVNVRSSYSTNSTIAGTVKKGTKVKLLSKKITDSLWYPTWYKVEYTSGSKTYSGYIFSDYIARYYTTSLKSDETLQIGLTGGYTSDNYTYTSSNTSIVKVTSKGVIKPQNSGSAIVEIISKKNRAIKLNVTVKPAEVAGITMSSKTLSLGVGDSSTLSTTATNVGAEYTVTYKSSNTSIAKVGATSGKVTAVAKGSATITATTDNGKTATCKVTVTDPPESVKFSKKSVKIGVGETYTTLTTVTPNIACTGKYTSSNTSVATVSSAGKITGKKTGSSTVSYTTYNSKSDSCCVTVKKAPTSVSLNLTKGTFGVGESYDLNPVFKSGEYSLVRTFTTSDKSVATVDETGIVTCKKIGKATITLSVYNGKTATCVITVKSAPSSVSFSEKEYFIGKGESFTLPVKLSTDSASYLKTFISSKNSVATVSTSGTLNGIKIGKSTVTVKTYNGKSGSCTVNVVNAPTKLKLSKSSLSLAVQKTYALKGTVGEGEACNKYTFSSANNKVAKVSSTGVITAVAPGTVNITVKTYNGVSKTCKVTVTGKAYAVVNSDVTKLNVRKSAKSDASVVTTVKAGNKLTIKSTSGSWYKITYKTYTGYVSSSYVTVKY